MRFLFAAASVKVAVGLVASSLVLTLPAAAPALPTWYYVALLLIFQISTAWLFIGGRRDVRARALATVLIAFATLFTDRILIRALSFSPDALDPAMRLIASVPLMAFCPYAFWQFVYAFPRPQVALGPVWLRPAMEYATLVTGVVLVAGNVLAAIPIAAEWPLTSALAWTAPTNEGLFWQALTFLILGCLVLLLVKWRRAALTERRRLAWVVLGIIVGNLPMLGHVVLAISVPSYARFAAEPETSRTLGIVLTLFTLLIPLTTIYAVAVEHVLDVSFVVRRAVQYALAKYTVVAAIVVLVVAVAAIAYGNRTRPLSEIVAGSPLAVGVVLLLAVLLLSRRALVNAIDRRFFRDHYDARQILVNLAERSQSLPSARDLTQLLVAEVGGALHLERVALLTVDDTGDTYGDPLGQVRPLTLSGPLGSILAGSHAPLDVDLSSSGSALSRLPEGEREWLADAGARLIVPLFGVRDTPMGLLILGDKRSELPFTQEDKRLMTAVAASAALALEQKLVHESPDLDTPSAPRTNGAQCAACGRVQPRPAQRCHACNGPMHDALLPIVLAGKFEVEQQIGAGGMGVVYRGRDLTLNRPVAMKVLPRLGSAAATRLRREARAMAALQHAHLAVIHVMESWRGAPVLVLEYLAGGTLAERVRHAQLPVSELVSIFTAVTEAVRHIHNAGYLHRDIKPSNLGFTVHGVPKLLDFGLVQIIADVSGNSTMVAAGVAAAAWQAGDPEATRAADAGNSSIRQFLGTPAYMSPEAIVLEPPGPPVDLWSLAVTMYEALTGRNPFRASSLAETVTLIMQADVPDPRTVRPDCPQALAQFLSRALARNRHQRPQTADEFLKGLQPARPV